MAEERPLCGRKPRFHTLRPFRLRTGTSLSDKSSGRRSCHRKPHSGRLAVLGGWEASGFVSHESGLFLTPQTINVDLCRARHTSHTYRSFRGNAGRRFQSQQRRAAHALPLVQYESVCTVPAGQYCIGNAGIGTIHGPGYENWDLSVFKNFRLKESLKFQLRGRSFNTLNQTNFAGVGTTLGETNYGQITSTGPARVLQLAGKLTFWICRGVKD